MSLTVFDRSSVHLKHSTMLYLIFLPFQLERYLGWVRAVPTFKAGRQR